MAPRSAVGATWAAVVGLGALIAATAHTSVWGGARAGVADPLGLLLSVAISFSLGGAGVAAIGAFARRAGRPLPGSVHTTVVAGVLLSLVAIGRAELRPEAPPTGVAAEAPEPGRLGVRLRSDWRGPATRRDADGAPASTPTDVFRGVGAFRRMVLVAGVLAIVLGLALRRRAVAASEQDEDRSAHDDAARAAAHDAVLLTIEGMLRDPDPRTAVIGAYARLQDELAGNDASRRDYEGPTEHLMRVLDVLEVRPTPLRSLVDLFEVARFSDHTLSARHREQALAALHEVASDLAPPRAGEGAPA